MRNRITGWLYRVYNRQIVRELVPSDRVASDRVPRHVGVITDGNRRWAKEFGATTEQGHRAGAEKIVQFLGWCDELGVELVTLYVLSRENLQRTPDEVAALATIIADLAHEIAASEKYRIHLVGELSVLPDELRTQLEAAQQCTATRNPSVHVNIAVGYGGRQEIVNAIKSLLRAEVASGKNIDQVIDALSEDSLSQHLYTKGQPDPDLIIRSSGEQRLSGFLMWQSAYSEFYFCEAYWPAFRKTDFLRAVRDYSQRQRRYGQ